MSQLVKEINLFFRNATKEDVTKLLSQIILSERQEKIFEMFYLKKKDVNYIADAVGISESIVRLEMNKIRLKIQRVLKI